jgi:SPP1 family predicted phage head-tail adaptor
MMGLAAGMLNRRIRVEKEVPLLGDDGQPLLDGADQPLTGWALHVRLWANIRTSNGREFIAGGVESATADASIRVRYRMDITPGMRVVLGASEAESGAIDYTGATFYDIVKPLPDVHRREHTDLVCRTGANEG